MVHLVPAKVRMVRRVTVAGSVARGGGTARMAPSVPRIRMLPRNPAASSSASRSRRASVARNALPMMGRGVAIVAATGVAGTGSARIAAVRMDAMDLARGKAAHAESRSR